MTMRIGFNRSTITRRRTIGAVTAVAAVGLVGLAVLPAMAAPTPTFLAKGDLPQGSQYTPWNASAVKKGLPSPQYTCIKGLLPKSGSSYKTYTGDLAAEVRQTITILKNTSEAKLIAKELRQGIEKCADKLDDPTTVKHYADYGLEDGLSVDGVFFAPPNSEFSLQLFGVGRDGRKVVVTTLSDMGRQSDAPVSAFTATAKTALSKAF